MVIHPGAPLQARRDEFRTPYLDFDRQPLPGCLGACLTDVRLLRPSLIGRLLRSITLHSPRYARETIAASDSMRAALATATISQTGS